jgi:hypothetical protein
MQEGIKDISSLAHSISFPIMQTALFFLQNATHTDTLKQLILEAMGRGYTRFLTMLPLTDNWGLVFDIRCSDMTQFPDNLFQADNILMVHDPLPWLCQQGDVVLAVWDGQEVYPLSELAYAKGWGLTGTYYNPTSLVTNAL